MYDQVRHGLQQASRVPGAPKLRLRQEQLQLQTRPGVQIRGEKGKHNLGKDKKKNFVKTSSFCQNINNGSFYRTLQRKIVS